MTQAFEKGGLSLDTNLTVNVYDDPWESNRQLSPEKLSEKTTYGLPNISTSAGTRHIYVGALDSKKSQKRTELRKALSQLLIQLANRDKPPSILDVIHNTSRASPERTIGALAETLKQAVKRRAGSKSNTERVAPGNTEDDSDDSDDTLFRTDSTIELVLQWSNLLTMAVNQRCQIFDDSNNDRSITDLDNSKVPDPFRKSRNSFRTGGKRSRPPSPVKGRNDVPGLLSSCLTILRSVVSEDCRYRVGSPSPSRPPNSLQILTLNVAQLLAYNHWHDPRVISEIGFALMPAFYSFPRQMQSHLLGFFDNSIVRVILHSLARLQGGSYQEPTIEYTYSGTSSATSEENDIPIVSIQIDEVLSPKSPPTIGQGRTTKSTRDDIQSTNNPRQSSHIYFLAFLIPPLIAAILDTLESSEDVDLNVDISTRASQLIRTISATKIDTYNDLLEVVAYRSPKPRRYAIASLCELWPKSVGHTIISSPFLSMGASTSNKHDHQSHPDPYSHQFVPWYFDLDDSKTRVGGVLHYDCRSCLKTIRGFSLMCPSCMTAVHFECYDYPAGNYHIQYGAGNEQRVQRIAMLRFSDILQNKQSKHASGDHAFETVNWFTLCLCYVCRKPLWGCFAQGIKCSKCTTALHVHCLSRLEKSQQCGIFEVNPNFVTIDQSSLRQSCLNHFPLLQQPTEDLKRCSYEEVSIYFSVLQTQLHILNNGLTFGSIVVHKSTGLPGNPTDIDHFELHHAIEQCRQLLNAGRLFLSPLTRQYMQDSNTQQRPSVMFNWSYLEYVTAAVKTSSPQTRHGGSTSSELLNIGQPHELNGDPQDNSTLPFESVTLMHIRNILRADFTLRSDIAAKFLLDQLHHLAFFDRLDRNPYPFDESSLESDLKCIFPLPLGLDLSLNVETLVSSIEAALSDLDLTTNEFGFLLLTRRFWPNGLASEYALKRLALRVLSWILDEDRTLAIILREYIAKQRRLPGLRIQTNLEPWPSPVGRLAPAGLSNNGGDFVSARRLLLTRFALPWLLQLHDLEPGFYCQVVFEACCHVIEDDSDVQLESTFFRTANDVKDLFTRCDDILRSIIKLSQCSVIFTVFDDLFLRWLERVFSLGVGDRVFSSLNRLFSLETAPLSAGIKATDTSEAFLNLPRDIYVDPLRAITTFAGQSETGLSLSISYLPMLVKSGSNIPVQTFRHFLALLMADKKSSPDNADAFVKAVALSLWSRSSGGPALQELIAQLHSHMASQISQCLVSGDNPNTCLSIIRLSLAACLRVYGCEKSIIASAGLISPIDVDDLPSQRKLAGNGANSDDPIFIHPTILIALDLYLQSQVDEVTCYVAKFLHIFLTETPLLEQFEIDNFILRNGKIIASCAWATYNLQREDAALARTGLLLRSLLIDPEPLQEILSANVEPTASSVKARLSAVNRLFRIVLDVTSPVFQVEGRQWRSSVIEVFNVYFSPLWADPSEEVRTAIRSSSAALLPAHFKIISQCWSECLSKAPIAERIHLLGFLLQLRAHFPKWQVLSWDSMIETLVEYGYVLKGNTDVLPSHDMISSSKNDNQHLSAADPDVTHLRASIVLLGLQMISDGIDIDSFSLMKLKVQLVHIAGFGGVSVIPTQSGQNFRLQFTEISEVENSAYPCIEELVHVVDAPHYMKAPKSVLGLSGPNEDVIENVLIGSVFLDVTLTMLGTLRRLTSLPVLTLKSLLEALYIISHKYDFLAFKHLQPLFLKAVLEAVDMQSQDVSYELRQLSLSIAQVSIGKWHALLGGFNISTILERVSTQIASQAQNSQDTLVVQGRMLIGNTLQMFCDKGLLLCLFCRPLDPKLFNCLSHVFNDQEHRDPSASVTLRESLLRDTLQGSVVCDSRSFPVMLQNVSKFVETVFFQGYRADLLTFCGHQLSLLVTRMSDGSIEGLDCSHIIKILAVLIQHNKKQCKGLFPHVDVVLHIALHRLVVDEPSLTQLIKAVAPKRANANSSEISGPIDIVKILFDILLDGFRMKTKMSPLTMKSLIQSLLSADAAMLLPASLTQRQPFRNMIDDAYNYLQNHSWTEDNVDLDYQSVAETAKLLLGAINRDPAHFQRLVEPATDKSLRLPPTLRTWNILLLVTLKESSNDWQSMIYDHFPSFCNTYSAMLRQYLSSGISSPTAATTDINQAHMAMKLWLMLAHSISIATHNGEIYITAVWNELWPAYESFLDVLDTEARVDLPALLSLASASAADLIMYMRSLKTSLSLDTSGFMAILNRMRALNLGDSSSHKISRTLRLMSEPLPQITSNVLLDQIAKELVAAEKIRIIETR